MIKIIGGGSKEKNIIWQILHVVAMKGYLVTLDSKILDFGCRHGEVVLVLRRLGFDAYGFDIHDYSASIEPKYRKYFSFLDNPVKVKSDYTMDWSKYRLPFSDQEFDLVFSLSVFEHVQNHDIVLREISRVLKVTGVSMHRYVSRYRIIDEHSYVPFGSIIKNYHYYFFWALCGVRNRHQAGKSAKEVANLNMRSAHINLNYLSSKNILKIANKYFSSAGFIPETWGFNRRLLSFFLKNPVIRYIYNNMCQSVLLLEK